ncbi:DEAD/DEAH box helicase [Pseudoroseomonas wenyumeiae]|uniref:DEAD/DEAH box helicase n=1 Tax=Teichococcus wenyumeiae TaxID=2478470 RepID=A0A3A9JJE0_9PROT|nr:DEAD/DEAH box helicase [Pseudoroseomonas wenyumeiae]RKK05351.1 DEAD/DEAH box helicase [Pseudoroseomonas wenyumeiae]RMI25554.1 DEAD/DEAH box helicase [Pseudoroseomonas wenyumeiae]
MPFSDSLPAVLLRALQERGYAEPTSVQAAVLEPETEGRDLLVSAQTGSGKTVAFGLAIAPDLMGGEDRMPQARTPLALVVAPTRELALQVKNELAWLYAPAGGRVVSCVGGMDPIAERRALSQGAHIVVGTPGRLRDHLERGNLVPDTLKAVVLDEADEMLDLGFREELEAILDAAPEGRRTLLFSATVPRAIATLAENYQNDALRIAAAQEGGQHGDIEYRVAVVAPHDMERAVVNLLRASDSPRAIVFCSTRAAVARLHANLTERGFLAVALSGELTQAERSRALQGLRDGKARVCVATDVAARGIDLPDLNLVIHAELPKEPETLLHRSGRTGRAGRKGVSVLVVPPSRRRFAERLLSAARLQASWGEAPSAESIRAQDTERLTAEATTLAAEEPTVEELDAARALLAQSNPEALAAALLRVLRAPLPAAEELSSVSVVEDRRPTRTPRTASAGEGAWFRLNVGRDGKADPRWILPFLCRRGHVARDEIGRIRILGRETRFEVAGHAAARFAAAARKPDPAEPHIRVEPLPPGAAEEPGRRSESRYRR